MTLDARQKRHRSLFTFDNYAQMLELWKAGQRSPRQDFTGARGP